MIAMANADSVEIHLSVYSTLTTIVSHGVQLMILHKVLLLLL